ncbi:caspase family protein [Nostoc sp. KVJ3]|uniref:caspase family protein n=1 Tax=Nostoc sp. KVJ3 TaxID=457945 RepID=UPI002237B95F|nr:caspase family protein [Nostoc sp. KVJ3]MCW5319162.1 caspase family protein [Nostoc sp. KVJ3]
MAFDSGYALVIGVGSYQNTPKLNVSLTVDDAQEVADVLQNSRYCGYLEQQVTLLHDADATRNNIEAAFDTLAKTLKESDTFFFFYSGHGEYGEDGYYLTTHETEIKDGKVLAGSGIHEKTLLEKIQAIKAKRVLLIFNACHSGEISPGSLGISEELPSQSLPNQTSEALIGTGEGRVIITACREAQKSYFVRNASMTIFAQALTDGLRGKNIINRRGYISIFDLYDYVFTKVKEEVAQRFGQFNLVQEPELTIHKGIGIMAVSLHRGKVPEGELTFEDRPPSLSGEVREVEPIDSQKALQQILSGEFKAAQDINLAGRDQYNLQGSQGAILNSSGNISQHFGNKTKINVSGDYAGRDMYKQKFMSSSTSETVISLESIYNQVKHRIGKAEQQGEDSLVEDLQPVELALKAAARAEKEGNLGRKVSKLSDAKQLLQNQVETYPELKNLLSLIKQVR